MTILCFTRIAVVFGTQARLPDIAVLATSEVVNTAVIFDYGATKTAGTDVLVYSPNGTLKATIHGTWSADLEVETTVSTDGKYHFATGSRSLGPAGSTTGSPVRGQEPSNLGITRIAGAERKFLGVFDIGITFHENKLAAGPMTNDGSVNIYVSEQFDSPSCPERHGLKAGANIGMINFNPVNMTASYDRPGAFNADPIGEAGPVFTGCYAEHPVTAMRLIGSRLYAVLFEPAAKGQATAYRLRYYDTSKSNKRSGIIAAFNVTDTMPTNGIGATILSRSSFLLHTPEGKQIVVRSGKPSTSEYTTGHGESDGGGSLSTASYGDSWLTLEGRHVGQWQPNSGYSRLVTSLDTKYQGLGISVALK